MWEDVVVVVVSIQKPNCSLPTSGRSTHKLLAGVYMLSEIRWPCRTCWANFQNVQRRQNVSRWAAVKLTVQRKSPNVQQCCFICPGKVTKFSASQSKANWKIKERRMSIIPDVRQLHILKRFNCTASVIIMFKGEDDYSAYHMQDRNVRRNSKCFREAWVHQWKYGREKRYQWYQMSDSIINSKDD